MICPEQGPKLMNREKAREFFSSYAEGTLDVGLRTSLEQRLASDVALKGEFVAFNETVEHLDALRFVSAPVPFDLHDKIAARLDLIAWEQKRTASPGWTGWLRNLAFAGVGAAAVIGAGFSIMSHGSGPSTAGPGFNVSTNQLTAKPVDGGVRINYIAGAPTTVAVLSSGESMRSDRLAANQAWETTLTNTQPHAAIFDITVSRDVDRMEIAVPGLTSSHPKTGNGSVEDLAKALAETYRVPVIMSGHDFSVGVSWNFDGLSVSEAAGDSLKTRGFTVEVKNGNAVWISQN